MFALYYRRNWRLILYAQSCKLHAMEACNRRIIRRSRWPVTKISRWNKAFAIRKSLFSLFWQCNIYLRRQKHSQKVALRHMKIHLLKFIQNAWISVERINETVWKLRDFFCSIHCAMLLNTVQLRNRFNGKERLIWNELRIKACPQQVTNTFFRKVFPSYVCIAMLNGSLNRYADFTIIRQTMLFVGLVE